MVQTKLIWDFYQLRKNKCKNKTYITELQNKKLRTMLLYAFDHSKYYQRAFMEKGIKREMINTLPLSEFPKMNKQTLIQNFDELVTVKGIHQEDIRIFDQQQTEGLFQYQYHVVHSSGSTGKPSYFLYQEDAWNQMLAGIIRGALWDLNWVEILKLLGSGLRIAYIAATNGRYGGAMAVGDGIKGVHAKQLFLDVNTPLSKWSQKLNQFNPNLIIGYPSAIKILCELMETESLDIDVKRIITCGEPLTYNLRRYLEDLFSCPVVNMYGTSESLALGVEVNYDEGMILFDDLNVIEVEGNAIYLTSLYNFAQPLIRYKITDHLKLHESQTEKCSFTKVHSIVGRSEEVLWFMDENGNKEFLHPLSIEGFSVKGLLDYQFIQLSKSSFEIVLQVKHKGVKDYVSEHITNQMQSVLHEKSLGYVSFHLSFVDHIMPNIKTGKKQLIVKQVNDDA